MKANWRGMKGNNRGERMLTPGFFVPNNAYELTLHLSANDFKALEFGPVKTS
jgi:hypothetical protein